MISESDNKHMLCLIDKVGIRNTAKQLGLKIPTLRARIRRARQNITSIMFVNEEHLDCSIYYEVIKNDEPFKIILGNIDRVNGKWRIEFTGRDLPVDSVELRYIADKIDELNKK